MTVHDLVDQISTLVENYLEEKDSYKSPVMTIGHERGKVVVHLNESKRVVRPKDSVEYDLKDLYITDELRAERPYFEAICKIAGDWIK